MEEDKNMRRSSIIKPRDKPRIRNSSNTDSNGEKRRNPGPEIDQRPHSRLSDAPKTSEYAFFKKLKKDAGRSVSNPMHKEDYQVKDANLNNRIREKSSELKYIYGGFKFSARIEKDRHDDHGCFSPSDHICFSPPVHVSKSSEIINMVETGSKNIRLPLLNQTMVPVNHNLWPSTFHGDLNNLGKRDSDKGVFSSKRQKLRHWVADTSLQEVGALCSKGCDLVCVLLSRLFPEQKEDYSSWEPKSCQGEIDTKYQLPSFPDYYKHSRGDHWPHLNNLMESESYSYLNDDFLGYCSGRTRDVILSRLDNMDLDSASTIYPIKPQLPCKYRKSYPILDGEMNESLFLGSNSCINLSSEEYGSITWDLKEFNESHVPNGTSLPGQPDNLLLGWDYNNVKDKRDLSILSNSTDMSLLTKSVDNDHRKNHDMQTENTPCLSSSFSSYFLNGISLARYCSASSLYSHDYGGHFRDEKYLFQEFDQFPLNFSCVPNSRKYLNMAEDSTTDNIFGCSNVVCSPHDHFWSLNEVNCEKSERGVEDDLSMFDSSTENHLSIIPASLYPQDYGNGAYSLDEEDSKCSSHFSKDGRNCQDWSALNFQISHYKEMGYSLLLHSPNIGSLIPERYVTEPDDYNEWKFI